MISLPLFWVFVGTMALLWYLNRGDKRRKGLKELPGPKAYPIVGNGLDLNGKEMHKVFNKWTQEFGPIYRVKMGNQLAIMISDPKLAKEIFSNDPNYVGRPHFEGFDIYDGERLGIVNSEGELWEVHRRFLLRQLRDFGFGKSAMESLIIDELNEVIANFKKNEGKPVTDIKKVMTLAVINSLWTVVSCRRFSHDDPMMMRLAVGTNEAVKEVFEKGLLLIAPWLRHVIPELSGYKKIRDTIDANRAFFEKTLNEHKRTFDENNMRDFIDVYLAEVKKTSDSKSVFYGSAAERQLVATIADLFFAGSDTTSTTLAWAVLYLCKYPQVQKKLQEEIASITNNSRYVSVADRPSMPYSLALIEEVLRCSSIVPDGVQHRAISSKEFHGYWIPKNAWIMVNMHYIHHDPKLWGDPENFRPERFLSEDGKEFKKSDSLIPFQLGRRQCVGETLARDTIFLFLTNIFQRFEVSFDPSKPEPTLETQLDFLLNPYPYSVIMKDRQGK